MSTSVYPDVDKGWAWVIMMAAFGSQFIAGALSYAAGVIHVALIQEFDDDIAFISLIGALFASLLCLQGPVVSLVINKWSCRVATSLGGLLMFVGMTASFFVKQSKFLLITYGIIAGSGLSFSAIPAVIVVGYSFEKYRGIAVGFNAAGAGMGMFASGPLVQSLIDEYGIRGAYLMFGAIAANIILMGALMRPPELELYIKQQVLQHKMPSEQTPKLRCRDAAVFRNLTFIMVLVSTAVWNIPYGTVLLHLPFYSVTQGSSHTQAALLITMIGLGSTISRFLSGIAVGPNGIDPLVLFMGFLGVAGILTISFPFYSMYYVGQIFYSLGFGVCSGGMIVLINPIAIAVVGMDELSTSVGLIFFGSGVGGLLGPVLAGFIVDHGGRYETSFYISGVCFIVSCLVTLASSIWRPKNRKTKNGSLPSPRETRYLSGSAHLSQSLSILYNEQQSFRNSMSSLGSKRLNVHISSDSIAVSQESNSVSQESLSVRRQPKRMNIEYPPKHVTRARTNSNDRYSEHIPESIPLRCHDITET